MNDSEYNILMQKATEFMRVQNDRIWNQWSLSEFPRFDWDQEKGIIIFGGAGENSVIADIQFIGSWSESAGTWMWAWGNEGISEPMKREIQEIRIFGKTNDLSELTDAVWSGPIEAAWDMASLSSYILQSEMIYRAPASKSKSYSFLSLRNFRKTTELNQALQTMTIAVTSAAAHPPRQQ
jgi:hypothetical protein